MNAPLEPNATIAAGAPAEIIRFSPPSRIVGSIGTPLVLAAVRGGPSSSFHIDAGTERRRFCDISFPVACS